MSLQKGETTRLFVAFGLTAHPNPVIVTAKARVPRPRLLVAHDGIR